MTEVSGTTSITTICPCCSKEIYVEDVEVTLEVDLSDFAPDRSWRD